MPASSKTIRTPALVFHKPSGRARVRIGGKDIYLGPWGTSNPRKPSAEVQREYRRVVAEWLASGKIPGETLDGLTVDALIEQYIERRGPALQTRTVEGSIEPILHRLSKLYGGTLAQDFGPSELRAFRNNVAREKKPNGGRLSRRYLNQKVVPTVRAMFRWAVEHEIVPPSTDHALSAVRALTPGECKDNPDPAGVAPVADEVVDATLPHLPPVVADMVRVQRLTGMRPGEVCSMTWAEIDRTGKVWTFKPEHHKTSHHEKTRIVRIGPKAQAVLTRYAMASFAGGPIFSPRQSEAERRARVAEARTTPVSCGNVAGSNRTEDPKRQPGEQYTSNSYGYAIARACLRAFPLPVELGPREGETDDAWTARLTDEERQQVREWRRAHRWAPNQLRHSAATKIRKSHGLEAAQAVLGHSELETTQVYAEKDEELAEAVALAVG